MSGVRNVQKIIRRVKLDVMIIDVAQPILMLHILLPHYSFCLALLYTCLSLASPFPVTNITSVGKIRITISGLTARSAARHPDRDAVRPAGIRVRSSQDLSGCWHSGQGPVSHLASRSAGWHPGQVCGYSGQGAVSHSAS